MLTRQQIGAIAQREGLPSHAVERDYVQHLILRRAAREPFVFKGGTCIRIALGSPRYSEDLDFNAECTAGETEAILREAARRLAEYGIPAEVVRRHPESGNFQAIVRFQGPLFGEDPRSQGSIRIEVSLRRERVEMEEVFVPRTPYADVPQLVIRALTKEHLLAEKTRALVVRRKPRDLYDVQFLLSRGVACSRSLLDEKMRLYGRRFRLGDLDEGIAEAGRTWDRDLGPLLGQAPPYPSVADGVRTGFRRMLRGGT